jgi:hypothetical protein
MNLDSAILLALAALVAMSAALHLLLSFGVVR